MKKILYALYSFIVIIANFRLKEKNYNFILLAIFFYIAVNSKWSFKNRLSK